MWLGVALVILHCRLEIRITKDNVYIDFTCEEEENSRNACCILEYWKLGNQWSTFILAHSFTQLIVHTIIIFHP